MTDTHVDSNCEHCCRRCGRWFALPARPGTRRPLLPAVCVQHVFADAALLVAGVSGLGLLLRVGVHHVLVRHACALADLGLRLLLLLVYVCFLLLQALAWLDDVFNEILLALLSLVGVGAGADCKLSAGNRLFLFLVKWIVPALSVVLLALKHKHEDYISIKRHTSFRKLRNIKTGVEKIPRQLCQFIKIE